MTQSGKLMTLEEFLTQRLAEDAATAQAALREPRFAWSSNAFVEVLEIAENEGTLSEALQHVARHDPERVLREVEAKRRIIERHNPCDDWSYGDASTCPELCLLALPYADHPDYDEGWKP